MKKYSYWGSEDAPPEHLKTTKQLGELGLKPVKPVGYIETRKYIIKLFDPNDPNSTRPKRKATPKQLAALQKARKKQQLMAECREWYRCIGFTKKDRIREIKWVRKVFEDMDNYIILDTETTGLYPSEVVEVGIINLSGKTVFHSLVKPKSEIPEDAIAIHGITNEEVALSPSFCEICPHLREIVEGKKVLIYNWQFDVSILSHCCCLDELEPLSFEGDCLMERWSIFCGQYSKYWRDYTWQPLNGGHRAIADCQAALECMRIMAKASIEFIDYVPEEFRDL